MKRKLILCLLLALALTAVMIPTAVLAAPADGAAPAEVPGTYADVASGSCGDGVYWSLDDRGNMYISGEGAMTNYAQPYNVPWAGYAEDITAVYFYSGIVNVGDHAFTDCTALTKISLSGGVKTIGREAFMGCTALTVVTIPSGVTYIDTRAFADCNNIKTVIFNCSAPTISPDMVFRGVEATVYYPPTPSWDTEKYNNYGGSLTWQCADQYDANITWSVTAGGELIISGTGAMTNGGIGNWANVQNEWDRATIGSGITGISRYAFSGCTSMQGVIIPNTVESIGADAFEDCSSLESVSIPSSVTEIQTAVFRNCTSLTNVTIPSSVTAIQNYAFDGCSSLESLSLPSGLQTLGVGVFMNCTSLTSMALPYSVELSRDGDSLFYGCTSLESITWPNGITAIGRYMFYNCTSLESIRVPWNVTTIGENAFQGCTSLTYAFLWWDVASIGRYAFDGCTSLKSVDLSGDLTDIGDYAFRNTGLENISIPKAVTNIGSGAFYGCSALSTLHFRGNAPTIYSTAFSGVTAEAFYYPVPSWNSAIHNNFGGTITWTPDNECGESATWSVSEDGVLTVSGTGEMRMPQSGGWYYVPDAWNTVVIDPGITAIGNYSFEYCENLTGITIPNTVTVIGESAFEGCPLLTDVVIPNSVTSIGAQAFNSCKSLTGIVIPNSVTSIGDYAFAVCTNLKNAVIGTGVTELKPGLFSGCTALETVDIPLSVTAIGVYAFYNCPALTDVYYGGDPTDWAKITIATDNEALTGAAIHYTYKPVAAPTNVKAIADTATTMKVSWDPVPGATQYVVYRKEGSADWKAFASTSGTSITLKSYLKHGYNYRFRIYAKNPAYTGAGSEIVLLKFVPPTPTGLNIASTGVGQATVKWDAIPNIKGYCVYYKRADDSGYTYAGATTATSKTITGLTTGARYAFKIRAYVQATSGIYSGENIFSEYCKYVSGEIVPAAPTGLKIASTAVGKATISWDKTPGVYAYCIYYKRADDSGYTYFGATTATSKTITGLTTGARYAFKIRAYAKPTDGPKAGQNVFGPYCTYVSGEIVPAAPTGLRIVSTGSGKATISWDAVSGAAAYCIYYKSADDTGYTYFGATVNTTKTITGLTTGKRYAFKIRAYATPTDGPKAGQNVFGPYCKYVSGEIVAQ